LNPQPGRLAAEAAFPITRRRAALPRRPARAGVSACAAPSQEDIMTVELSPEEWAQVRYKYEHTDQPTEDICADHGFSSGTLRDRVRRWGWTRRHPPIAAEGPPPLQPVEPAPPLAPATAVPDAGPAGEAAPADPAEIVPRLQGAVARVLPAIEATVAKLAAGPLPPREMERAARTLTSLTRTLRELNGLLGQQQPGAGRVCTCDMPEDIDAFRIDLARRIDAFVAANTEPEPGARPPEGYLPIGA
jgi:hypothetical protein